MRRFGINSRMLGRGLIGVLLLAGVLTPNIASAEPLDGQVRGQVRQVLDREGYIGKYLNGQELKRGVSAYLWDHRQSLRKSDFHSSVQVDVLICLLIERGYPGFEQCAENQVFMKRCRSLIK